MNNTTLNVPATVMQYFQDDSANPRHLMCHAVKLMCENIDQPLVQNCITTIKKFDSLTIESTDEQMFAALTQEDIAHFNAFYLELDKQLAKQA